MLVCACVRACAQDKLLKVWDPRTSSPAQECSPHEGVKCFKLCWLGDKNGICTVGFTKQSKREFKLFDMRNLSCVLSIWSPVVLLLLLLSRSRLRCRCCCCDQRALLRERDRPGRWRHHAVL